MSIQKLLVKNYNKNLDTKPYEGFQLICSHMTPLSGEQSSPVACTVHDADKFNDVVSWSEAIDQQIAASREETHAFADLLDRTPQLGMIKPSFRIG